MPYVVRIGVQDVVVQREAGAVSGPIAVGVRACLKDGVQDVVGQREAGAVPGSIAVGVRACLENGVQDVVGACCQEAFREAPDALGGRPPDYCPGIRQGSEELDHGVLHLIRDREEVCAIVIPAPPAAVDPLVTTGAKTIRELCPSQAG